MRRKEGGQAPGLACGEMVVRTELHHLITSQLIPADGLFRNSTACILLPRILQVSSTTMHP